VLLQQGIELSKVNFVDGIDGHFEHSQLDVSRCLDPVLAFTFSMQFTFPDVKGRRRRRRS
jgi:hypothetical protein